MNFEARFAVSRERWIKDMEESKADLGKILDRGFKFMQTHMDRTIGHVI